jgi:hypothetical protein
MNKDWWNIELEQKPDFEKSMKRIYAWYNQEIEDRPPIRFSAHNQEYDSAITLPGYKFNSLKERWWNTDYQLELFEYGLKNSCFNAETFPIFWPNLGPEVYTAFYGVDLEYQEITSYAKPIILDWSELDSIKLNLENPYFLKIEEMTRAALERNKGKYLVGYTDLHPGIDCAAAFRQPEMLCLDLLLNPEKVNQLVELSSKDFHFIFNYFDKILKDHKQPSVTWMGIPSFGKMHIPSCDFSSMIAPEHFEEFVLPWIIKEIKPMTHNIFHVDGKGVANHIDMILELPQINAIQWVQGVGDDLPIMQWVSLIKKIQNAGKSVVVDLAPSELESFMAAVKPKGIFLCINADLSIQQDIIKKVEKWK